MPDKASRYFIPSTATEVITEIKRSRFIAYISHAANAEDAFSIIKQRQTLYPDARHHCWAFIACPPKSASAVRFSDDGEPSGTAGKPILNVLQYSHYGEIICVISRYFGGIKLGASGLVRAYSNSTQAAIEQLPIKEVVELTILSVQFPYAVESSVRHYLASKQITISDINYLEAIVFHLEVEHNHIQSIMQQIQNICRGKALQLPTL